MDYLILAINPGSTSTKIALYANEKEIFVKTIEHPAYEIAKYNKVSEQFEMRKEMVLTFLKNNGFETGQLSAVVGRGGMLPSVKSGAYRVNNQMVERLKNNPITDHASNLGALVAYEIANSAGIPSYIYDSVRVDELEDIARISGMPDIPRTSTSHALNSRAMAIRAAKKYGRKYSDMTFIVAHLGGGISLSVHAKGSMVDIIADDEGPFSPERAGRVPCKDLIDLCYKVKYDRTTMQKKLRGNGGLKAYLGTTDARIVENLIEDGNYEAKLIYEAMAYQVAKGIGELATVVKGKVDRIILTGGLAQSPLLTKWIKDRVEFIAPVEIMPGENELESLAFGALRVLEGKEELKEYVD
ncbi:butyrate kinase [Desulfosporosinus orientis DSM 765]|uniref:Probable butyrate kinase n=1 Tax=Desulfosporosinus orientis (strain ATCC 19365 / DSM 765 / NCIMB 8382 / VKM B-1628 / Singapore I) TaxID=768706 RepID=G7W6W9_DESOD|nr:butyrate kinase [Desulfosporosinus orientis]AET69826.1 butyrate kinase [Desulfosporosinus orientis DSM 765]